MEFHTLPPLSLYIHLPWCIRKCPYCDFNSHAAPEGIPAEEYVDALLRDVERELPGVWGRSVGTVYLGGGTPSLFPPAAISRLLSGVRARLPLAPDAEITLEANPGTVDQERFDAFREAGVNRLSIGVQSFEPGRLEALGRIHGRDEALAAADAARRAGFDNLNLDLMFGLPGQTVEAALADLDTAVGLGPGHLSVYQLTLEPNTLFHRHPPELPGEDTVAAMHDALHARLADAGYGHYEVSAFARSDRRCRHNLNYWRFGDYVGIGAGAHGKVSRPDGIRRRWKQRHPQRYLDTAGGDAAVGGERELSGDEALFEFLLNALRLTEGFEIELFERHAGLPGSLLERAIVPAVDKGLLERPGECLRPTELGRRYLDDLVGMFLPEGRERVASSE
jgi:oxygen-independent coproporphyrinogen-3 oxidase